MKPKMCISAEPPAKPRQRTALSASLIALLVSICVGAALLECGSFLALKYLIKHHNFDQGKYERELHIFRRAENDVVYFTVKKHYRQMFNSDEFRTEIRTNNMGFREDGDYNGEKIDIGFLGDSFVFGHGVNYGERISDRFRSYFPGRSIMSYAYANGANPIHYYLYLKKNPKLIPKIAVLCLFLGNDLTTDISETEVRLDSAGEISSTTSRIRTVDDEGFVVSFSDRITLQKKKIAYDFLQSFSTGKLVLITYLMKKGIYKRVPETAQALKNESGKQRPKETEQTRIFEPFHNGILDDNAKRSLEMIRLTRDFIAQHDSRLIVFMIPESFTAGEYAYQCPYGNCAELREKQYLQKSLHGWFRENQIEFIDPTSIFRQLEENGARLYHEWDAHWTPAGHAAAAEILRRYLSA